MRGRPPKKPDAAMLERAALDYLGRYASSAENLRRVLTRKLKRAATADEDGAALVAGIVERYRSAGLLDDGAYAEAQVAALRRRGGSRAAIAARLSAKGVGGDEIEAALRGDGAGGELAAACALARRRRLGPYRAEPDRNKDLAAFARAGFSQEIARQVLACRSVEEVERLLKPS